MAIVPANCEICLMEGIESIELAYLDRDMTATQVMEKLNVKPYTWRNHINNHVKPQLAIQLANRTELADHVVDKVGEVIKGLEDLKDVMSLLKQNILNNPDPHQLKIYLSGLAEIRHYTETLQKLQGDFKESGKLQAQTINVQYNNLAGQILQDACPMCKKKFLTTLEPILKPDVSNHS
jgi:hypothetical protein